MWLTYKFKREKTIDYQDWSNVNTESLQTISRSESEGDTAVGTKTRVLWGHNQKKGDAYRRWNLMQTQVSIEVSDISLPASSQLFIIINNDRYFCFSLLCT